MSKADHRQIAVDCAQAAAATKSKGDRAQLLQIRAAHLKLAELEEKAVGATTGRSAAAGVKTREP